MAGYRYEQKRMERNIKESRRRGSLIFNLLIVSTAYCNFVRVYLLATRECDFKIIEKLEIYKTLPVTMLPDALELFMVIGGCRDTVYKVL